MDCTIVKYGRAGGTLIAMMMEWLFPACSPRDELSESVNNDDTSVDSQDMLWSQPLNVSKEIL